MIRDDDVIVTV